MKKSLRYGLIALVVVVAAVVAAPLLLVDKAAIKREIASAVEQRTGRQLDIAGDIGVALLPTPRVTAETVRLANWGESAEPWMLEIPRVTATVSLLDLLGGDFVVRTVALQSPRLLLERRAGRANWNFLPPGQLPPRPAAAPGLIAAAHAADGRSGDAAPLFRRLVVEDGWIGYRDANGGKDVEASAVEVMVALETANGPFQGGGSANIGGHAVAFDGDIGRIQPGRAVPVRLNAHLGAALVRLDGLLLRDTDSGPVLKASLDAKAPDIAEAVRRFGVVLSDAFKGRGIAYTGELRLDAGSGEVGNGRLQFGPLNAALSLDWNLEAARPRVGVRASAPHVDLDAWSEPQTRASRDTALAGLPRLVAPAAAAEPAAFALPAEVDIGFDIAADTVVWRGQAVQGVIAEGEISRGDLVLNQAAAQFPGAAQARVFGFVGGGLAMRNLDLTVQASAANLRGLLDWVGADVAAIPSDRLRRASLAAAISGNRDALIRVRDIDLALDSARAKGALDLRWAARPAFGVSLAVDHFNFDAYRPVAAPGQPTTAAPRAIPAMLADDAVIAQAPARPAAPPGPPLWTGFDANLDLRVGRLTLGGQPLDSVTAKGQWQGGVLDVAALSADIGGDGRLKATGKIRTVGEGAPRFEAINAEVNTPRADRLLALLPGGVPAFAREWRGLEASLRADGPLADLALNAAATVGEVKARLSGRFDGVKGIPADTGNAAITAPHLGALAAAFGAEIAPDLARKGKVEIQVPITTNAQGYAVPAFTARAGDIAIDGSAEVRTDGPRPFATVKLSGNTLPWVTLAKAPAAAPRRAASATGLIPAAITPAAEAAPAWAALRDFDGELSARFDALVTPKLRATAVVADARLNQGRVTLDQAAAQLLGGSVRATGTADLTGQPRLVANLAVADVVIAATSPLFDGNAPLAGKITLTAEGEATGADQDALLRALNGKGEIRIVQGSFAGADLGAVNDRLNRIRNLQDILGAIEAGSRGRTSFDTLTGHFTIENGVMKSDDLALGAPAGTATATGSANLAAQTLDTDLRFTLANLAEAPPLGIKLSGAWAQPRVIFDTGAFQGHVLKKGLGEFLKSLSKPQGDEPPPPAKIKPKDVLREILAPIQKQPEG